MQFSQLKLSFRLSGHIFEIQVTDPIQSNVPRKVSIPLNGQKGLAKRLATALYNLFDESYGFLKNSIFG